MDTSCANGFTTISLSQDEVQEYQEELALIEHHRRTARWLERDLYSQIRERHGIDLATENWELDVEGEKLTRNLETT